MKIIGLLGGMSWESTVPYYRHINELVKTRLGGLHSAEIVLYSVDFHEIEELQRRGDWAEAGRRLTAAALALQSAGAECLVLCTNTMHMVAGDIQAAIRIPLLHIADATAAAVRANRVEVVGLLGTRFTMEQDFYVRRLRDQHGLQVLVPEEHERAEVHRIIYEELCLGRILDTSRDAYHRVISRLVERGVQGIILGCTEISLLVDPTELVVPGFDTTRLHAEFAVDFALA